MDTPPEKPQFDAALGGTVEIPTAIQIQSFVKARIDEIEALTHIIEMPNSNKILQQKFPKHLRRRAMSHNVQRLPTRLREEYLDKREKSGTREIPVKRPRRKYRRRPSNLLAEYNRRQRTHIWLETHIWHAKRFHMIEKWGYKLPNFPNDKSYRACYRASTKHCLIQDISYYCCLELSGVMNDLVRGLNMHCSNACGLTFSSAYIQSGCYESSLFFYESNKYPEGAVGEIQYFWKPPKKDSRRTLWLWCHPSFYHQVLEELVKTFSLELEEQMIVDVGEEVSSEKAKMICRNVPFAKATKYNSKANTVSMVLLKDTLNRFRLIGPLSQAVFTQAFIPVDIEKRTLQDWVTDYTGKEGLSCCRKQSEFWQKMKNITSPAQLPRHLITSLIVTDPRFTLPSSRKKAEPKIEGLEFQSLLTPESELSNSAIWSSEIRDEVTERKLSTHQLNQMRSDKLVPGLEIESKDSNLSNLPAVPLLLIQDPGEDNDSKPLGYGSGWDIIVPSGYGMPFWLALNLHGGRAGGLKEYTSVSRERSHIMFPPDTSAGNTQEKFLEEEQKEKYFALPPAKRNSYVKLGVTSPFRCPWEILMSDWTGNKTFYVLRDKEKLKELKSKLNDPACPISFHQKDLQSLIPVIIKLKSKGTLDRNSTICIPEIDDLMKYSESRAYSGPIEPQHNDYSESERTQCRLEHKVKLRSLSRKRKTSRKSNENVSSLSSESLITKQKEIMRKLWLPDCQTVQNYCSRTVFGFVCDADFSFTNAHTVGLGYVALKGLLQFIERLSTIEKPCKQVLVRNINTQQYRFAQLSVIL